MPLRPVAALAWSVGLAVAERCDALPVSPQAVGDRLLQRTWAARQHRAAQDHAWVEVELLRGPDADVELDREVGLDLSSRQTQDDLAERALPDPWWVPAAWWLSEATAVGALLAARRLVQRAVRGWSEDDVSELCEVLPATVGAQLLALADRAGRRIPDPDDPDHPAAAAFAEQLRAHGRTLVARGDPQGERARTLQAWHDVATTPGHDPLLEARLSEARVRAVADASAAVRRSLVWVAEHLDELWD